MKRMRKIFSMIMMIGVLCIGLGGKSYAYDAYSVKINDTTKIYLDEAANKTITSYRWSSSDSRVIRIVSSNARYCLVEGVDSYYGKSVVITCNYKYMIGGTIISTSRSYRVSLIDTGSTGSSGGTTGQSTIQAAVSSINLDLAKTKEVRILLQIGGTVPKTWIIRDFLKSGSEQAVAYSTTTSNSQYIFIEAKNPGTTQIRFSLYDYGDGSAVFLNSTVVTVNVSCSHKYDSGKVTKAATTTGTGEKIYTCECCKSTKTEVIPKITQTQSTTTQTQSTTAQTTTTSATKPSTQSATLSKAPVLKSVQNQKNGILVSWKPVSGATGYYVYRKDGSSGYYKKIASTYGTSFLDRRVKSGTGYSYTVRAIVSKRLSDYNEKGLFMIYQTKPRLFSVKNNAAGRVTFAFQMDKKTTGYEIQVATDRKFSKNRKRWNLKSRYNGKVSYYITGMKKNTRIYVRIRSYKQKGNVKYFSTWSNAWTVRIRK